MKNISNNTEGIIKIVLNKNNALTEDQRKLLYSLFSSLSPSSNKKEESEPCPNCDDVSSDDSMYDADGNMLNTHEEYCPHCHVIRLIEEVTINTLLQPGKLSADSVQNLRLLSNIRSEYIRVV